MACCPASRLSSYVYTFCFSFSPSFVSTSFGHSLIYCLRPDTKYNRLFILWLVLHKELGQNSGPVFQIFAQGG